MLLIDDEGRLSLRPRQRCARLLDEDALLDLQRCGVLRGGRLIRTDHNGSGARQRQSRIVRAACARRARCRVEVVNAKLPAIEPKPVEAAPPVRVDETSVWP